MITITVVFLHGTIRASSPDDLKLTDSPDRGDWPPSPARLFAALVAADGTRGRMRVTTGEELAILEVASPPRILANPRSEIELSQLVGRYVVADGTASNTVQNYPARVATLIRPGTRIAPRDPVITYVWDDLEATDVVVEGLRRRAARIGYLGCADSPVQVTVATSLPFSAPDTEWRPDDDGDAIVPVPFDGLTTVLDHMYDDFSHGLPVKRSWYPIQHQRYRSPDAPLRPLEPAWPVVHILPFATRIPARRAVQVSEATKSALLSTYADKFKVPADEMPWALTGHPPTGLGGYQLVQYAPLPDVGHVNATGMIHGVAIMIPSTLEAVLILRILETLNELTVLRLHGGYTARIAATVGSSRAVSLETWRGPSRTWATVYPFRHERYARGSRRLREIAQAFRNAGYPGPDIAVAVAESAVTGAPRLTRSEIVRTGRHDQMPSTHLLVYFNAPVAGPVVAGRGRQYGMGLMRPVSDSMWREFQS